MENVIVKGQLRVSRDMEEKVFKQVEYGGLIYTWKQNIKVWEVCQTGEKNLNKEVMRNKREAMRCGIIERH